MKMTQKVNEPTIPTKEQKTVEGKQWGFNTARKYRTRRRPSTGLLTKI